MRIAIIGTGISGLVAAHLLHPHHDLTLFEANDYIGGHTHTVDVAVAGCRHAVDTGFIVFNDHTYPNFIELLRQLGVRTQPTSMSFSVHCDHCGLEYASQSLNSMFAQRGNLLRPGFQRLLIDIARFNRHATAVLGQHDNEQTLADFVARQGYSRNFVQHYLLPLGAAIWSCPPGRLLEFPMRFLAEFYHNHGMLSMWRRPQWRVIQGGSREYVRVLTRPFRERIRLGCPVAAVTRAADHVLVQPRAGQAEHFDHVILACHSDQALRMVTNPLPVEQELLGCFAYQQNEVVLHTDTSLLPANRRAWACWNYRVPRSEQDTVAVTYNMNLLQSIDAPHTYCVSINESGHIDPARILRRFTYSHPRYDTRQRAAQARRQELARLQRLSYCGAYWGFGFHEDGVNSALAVCKEFGVAL